MPEIGQREMARPHGTPDRNPNPWPSRLPQFLSCRIIRTDGKKRPQTNRKHIGESRASTLHSIPRSEERTVELHLDVPVLQIHGSSATSSRFLQFLGGTRKNLELARSTKHRDSSPTCHLFPFVREFTEVILLRPRQAQRSIALGNRESRCTVACSAPTGGSLLQRVSSPSQERHRQAQVRVH